MEDIEKWPDYLPGFPAHLKALGVISLEYGFLEGMFEALFADATEMNRAQVSALFQRIPNNHRTEIMLELLDKTKIPTNIKTLVRHFVAGFRICVENRSGLMHSHSGGLFHSESRPGHYGFVFTKISKSGNRLVCTPNLGELMRVADAMHEYGVFAGWLGNAILITKSKGDPEDSTWLPPSLSKPTPPPLLNWCEETIFLARTIPPSPSQA